MRFALLSSFLLVGIVEAGAQTTAKPAQPQPAPSQPRAAPTTPAPARTTTTQARRPAAPARGGMTITVTNLIGATLPGVRVAVVGPTDRAGETDASGHLNLTSMQAGTYRLSFSGEGVVSFEKEVTLRAGQVADVDVALTPAPEPPPPPPPQPDPDPPPPPPAAIGPAGQPLTVGIEDLLDRDFVGREPRRESLLSCSGNERASMIQLNEPMPRRVYENADLVYYVLAGEGTVTLDTRNSRVATNAFISVPRGTPHSFERRGNRPLVLLAVLGGEPCERAK